MISDVNFGIIFGQLFVFGVVAVTAYRVFCCIPSKWMD
jgi:hypothetical protein